MLFDIKLRYTGEIITGEFAKCRTATDVAALLVLARDFVVVVEHLITGTEPHRIREKVVPVRDIAHVTQTDK